MKIQSAVIASILFAATPAFSAIASPSSASAKAGIDWQKDNNVDAAFARAKASNKPLFLYWGAVWCPPCNQVKATIFNRQDFIDRSRHFVPVYLDGDSPSAQKLGARFKVRGYPTMILFKPDGTEITRLPGEVDSERYLQVLTLAMNTTNSVQDILKSALAGGKNLKAEEWSLLADYSWDDPEQKLVDGKDVAATLLRLSDIAPAGHDATRIYLKALVAIANVKPGQAAPAFDKAAALDKLHKALADQSVARDNMDLLTNYPVDLTELATTAKSDASSRLTGAFNSALLRLADDATLSKTDRLTAVDGLVALARQENPKGALDARLLTDVQKRVAQIDQATTDAYERQSVINAAGHALSNAGLLDESDALLKAELKRSHSPYYFMLSLASNAKKRGDKAAAVNWYEQAYKAAKGPATRLQWGATYVSGLIELAPQEEARIEKATQNVLAEIGGTENAFYERNRASLERMGKKLNEWNKDGKHKVAVQKVRTQLDGICGKLPANDPQKAVCQGVLSEAKS
ncbi:thioredoxin family protein [Undibacterium sp.]|jgi:thioredoxin-related protein|uniref:thioredoxin family protein n=1 Tax=Undibacterium sp. TaxID=1914977 RepID=UPI002BBA8BC9|nr:thioredoxin family protein [Undibacterium sp.]HTD03276.1 thioredoxin family protein [Undibacterium sp.]